MNRLSILNCYNYIFIYYWSNIAYNILFIKIRRKTFWNILVYCFNIRSSIVNFSNASTSSFYLFNKNITETSLASAFIPVLLLWQRKTFLFTNFFLSWKILVYFLCKNCNLTPFLKNVTPSFLTTHLKKLMSCQTPPF